MFAQGLLDGTDKRVSSDLFMKNMEYFDFPMESVEGDDLNGGYWEAKLESLVPILSEALAGSSLPSGGNMSNASSIVVPGLPDPSQESELKSVGKSVEEASKASISFQKNDSAGLDARAFQVPSPVSVLGSSSSCSSVKSLSTSSEIITRSECSLFSTINPYCFASSESNLPKTTTNPVRRTQKKKMKRAELSGATEMRQNSLGQFVASKKCTNCEVRKTPQWRDGPMGPKTLCNACGLRYRSGRPLFPNDRPAASPTSVPSLHSNSQKKVVETGQKAFPEAAMEGDHLDGGYWDAKLQDPLLGSNVGNATLVALPSLSNPGEESELKPLPNFVEAASKSSVSLQNNYSGGLDSRTLQALGPVSVHQSSRSSCSSEKSMSMSSGILTRSKRKLSSTINPHGFAASEQFSKSSGSSESMLRNTKRTPKRTPVKSKLQKCSHCDSTRTPQWRNGPMGPNTLCNACGVRYRSGRLFPEYRPASSPAFVPSLHSNSHRKVVEMRNEAIRKAAATETKPSALPFPELGAGEQYF